MTERVIHSKPLDLVKIWRIFPIIIEDGERDRVSYLLNSGVQNLYHVKYAFGVFDENRNDIFDSKSGRGMTHYREGLGGTDVTCSDNITEQAYYSPEGKFQ